MKYMAVAVGKKSGVFMGEMTEMTWGAGTRELSAACCGVVP